jgi:hypothetical protein
MLRVFILQQVGHRFTEPSARLDRPRWCGSIVSRNRPTEHQNATARACRVVEEVHRVQRVDVDVRPTGHVVTIVGFAQQPRQRSYGVVDVHRWGPTPREEQVKNRLADMQPQVPFGFCDTELR